MNDKHSFIIPAAIFTVAVSIAGGFLATQAQAPTAWLRSTPEPTLQAPGNAQINGGLAVGSSATPGADGTITTTGAINPAGGVILNTAGATNGLLIPNGNVGIETTNPLSKLSVGGDGIAGYGIYIGGASGSNSIYANGHTFIGGNLGVGIYNGSGASYRLRVSGDLKVDGKLFAAAVDNLRVDGLMSASRFIVVNFGDNTGAYPAAPSCSDHGAPGPSFPSGGGPPIIFYYNRDLSLGGYSEATEPTSAVKAVMMSAYAAILGGQGDEPWPISTVNTYTHLYAQDFTSACTRGPYDGYMDSDGTMITMCGWQLDGVTVRATIAVCYISP